MAKKKDGEYVCDFCGCGGPIKIRRNLKTNQQEFGCEDCWSMGDMYQLYSQSGFPAHKGFKIGDVVWCKETYCDNSEEWHKGLINGISIIRAGNKTMYCYECFYIDEGYDIEEQSYFWEEDIWARKEPEFDEFEKDVIYSNVFKSKLHKKLMTFDYTDRIITSDKHKDDSRKMCKEIGCGGCKWEHEVGCTGKYEPSNAFIDDTKPNPDEEDESNFDNPCKNGCKGCKFEDHCSERSEQPTTNEEKQRDFEIMKDDASCLRDIDCDECNKYNDCLDRL